MSPPRTVLYIDSSPKVGGGQVSLAALLERLDRGRYRPLLATPPGSGLERLATSLGVETLPLAIASRTARRTGMKEGRFRGWHEEPWRLLGAARAVGTWIRLHGVAVVHANNRLAGLVASLAPGSPRTPLVFHHRVETHLDGAGRLVLRRASRVVCVSRAVAEAAGGGDKVRVIYDGVDVGAFDRAGAAGSGADGMPLRVVVLGRLSPEKGQDVFLEAARDVARERPGVHFIVAGEAFLPGDVAFESRLRALARTPPLDGRVQFTGFHAEVPRLFAEADLVVVPSLREGLGIAALEAMAARRAVIASDVGGLRETVIAGETGLFVPPGDARAQARAMIDLVDEPGRRRVMGEAGRRRVEERFTREIMTRDVVSLYDELTAG